MAVSPRLMAITKQVDRFTDVLGLTVAWLNVPLVVAELVPPRRTPG
jgi:TRAP-type mannitol/chloroaromatic compound transport system permease small subunit